MTISPVERRIRAGFPFVRFLQAYLPHSLSGSLSKLGVRTARLDADVSHSSTSAAGVPCEWIIPNNHSADRVLLYLHGGGFVYGLNPMHLKMVAYLIKKIGARALMVDYRLAPKYPFPAALDDCVTAYQWLLDQGFPAEGIALAGDSAGGNLVLTSLMKLRDTGEPLPSAAACLSPVADLTGRENIEPEFKDPLLPLRAVKYYNESYVGNNDPHHPYLSPVFGLWHSLPPLLIHAGEDEFLRSDAVRVERLASSAGVDVNLEIYPRMWHVWQLYLSLPQAIQSLEEIALFLKEHLAARVGEAPQLQEPLNL